MIDTLKLLLKISLKEVRYQELRRTKEVYLAHRNGGFTLIELLVGLIIASIVITPIMSFMINILDTSRREEAKASSEQEVESALNYIAQDLNQAVYIYNATGLDNSNLNTNPGISGIKDQIPPVASATRLY
jgi:prepilin-type N-terminal cleavage/methylation domain-containing protein